MENQHPITPPPELVQQWMTEYTETKPNCLGTEFIASRATQWGADQELEACCDWLDKRFRRDPFFSEALRAARRKAPTLKEQALQALSEAVKMADDVPPEGICSDQADIIRRALEQLPDHE